VQIAADRTSDAEISFGKVIEIRAKLIAETTARLDWRNDLALAYVDLGHVQAMRDRISEAAVSFRSAVEVRQKLCDDYPTNQDFRVRLTNDLVQCGDALALSGQWSPAAGLYARAVQTSDHSWQVLWPCALMQLASGNEAGYRATCAELLQRHSAGATSDALLAITMTMVVGTHSLDDMNQAVTLAKQAADANPADARMSLLVGAAQYRAGRAKEAIATLTNSLERLETAQPDKIEPVLVCRIVGHMLLAQAYHEQADSAARQRQIDALRQLLDRRTAGAPHFQGPLPPWTVGFAVEIAQRELDKLSPPVAADR